MRRLTIAAASQAAPVTATKHEYGEYQACVANLRGPTCGESTSDEPIAADSAPAGDSVIRHSRYATSSAAPIVPMENGFMMCHGSCSANTCASRPATQNQAGG